MSCEMMTAKSADQLKLNYDTDSARISEGSRAQDNKAEMGCGVEESARCSHAKATCIEGEIGRDGRERCHRPSPGSQAVSSSSVSSSAHYPPPSINSAIKLMPQRTQRALTPLRSI